VLFLANLLAACGSAPQKEAVAEPSAAQAVPATEATTSAVSLPDTTSGQTDAKAVAAATPVAEVQVSTGASATADEALANRSVFFPFDVDTVQTADIDMIMAHGKNLSEHANLKVRVEGNADERGSSEYNLALASVVPITPRRHWCWWCALGPDRDCQLRRGEAACHRA